MQIAVMTALDDAFESIAASAPLNVLDSLMPWHADGTTHQTDWPEIRDALALLDARLMALAPGGPERRESVRSWWRLQVERQVLAFRREAQWRLQGATPDLHSYLAVAARSIGVDWTAASLIALDPDSVVPGPHTVIWGAIDAIARAIRLANDLHDPARERLEGKPQWQLIREGELMGGGVAQIDAEAQARAELQATASLEAARARGLIITAARVSGSARLREGLEGLLAIGLAVYAPELEPVAA